MSNRQRRVDISPRGLWLVPRYLSEIWDNHKGYNVGHLAVKMISTPGMVSNMAKNVTSEGSFSYLQQAPEEHEFVFSNNVGHNMVAMLEDKSGLKEDYEIKSGKLSIQGKIVKKADCRPNDKNYMRMKIEQIQKSQQPKKFVKQLERAAVKFKPVSFHEEEAAMIKQKKQGAKLARADEDVVRTALFHAFEKHQYYRLVDLQQLTQQPANYLKEILQEIAVYNMAPPHKSMWELKPEYSNYSIKE